MTTDAKRIGSYYFVYGVVSAIIGSVLSMLIRRKLIKVKLLNDNVVVISNGNREGVQPMVPSAYNQPGNIRYYSSIRKNSGKSGLGIIKEVIKKGSKTPNLPKNLFNFHNKLWVRILRVLGHNSAVLLLLSSNKDFNITYSVVYFYIIWIFSAINLVYGGWITYHIIVHSQKVLKSGELDIKNSPTNKMATAITKSYFCFKGICECISYVGVGLGFGAGIDEALRHGGQGPIFMPAFGKIISPLIPVNDRMLINLTRNKKECYEEGVRLWNEYYWAHRHNDVTTSNALEREINNNNLKMDELQSKIDQVKRKLIKKNNEK